MKYMFQFDRPGDDEIVDAVGDGRRIGHIRSRLHLRRFDTRWLRAQLHRLEAEGRVHRPERYQSASSYYWTTAPDASVEGGAT